MIHLRLVAPEDAAHKALEILHGSPAVLNVVHLHAAAKKPDGDLILCDVAREEASVIIGDLKELEIPRVGSIAVEDIDITLSDAAEAAEKAAPGLPSDAVVWEEVEQRTSENTELSVSFVAFMVLAMQIGAVGILLDQPILIVGAMVVGPEYSAIIASQWSRARRFSGSSPSSTSKTRSPTSAPCSRAPSSLYNVSAISDCSMAQVS